MFVLMATLGMCFPILSVTLDENASLAMYDKYSSV